MNHFGLKDRPCEMLLPNLRDSQIKKKQLFSHAATSIFKQKSGYILQLLSKLPGTSKMKVTQKSY